MKSTGTKILFSALVLTLAACSGGGGGGGSVSGDVANDSPTITNPPTAAKGTSEEMDALVEAVGAGATVNQVVAKLFSVFGSTPASKKSQKVGGEELQPCMSEAGSALDLGGLPTNADHDAFDKKYRFKATNCTGEGVDEWSGFVTTYSMDLAIDDANDTDENSNGSVKLKETYVWNSAAKAEVAAGYRAAGISYAGASGLIKMDYKSGGYSNNELAPQPQGYMALWLSVQLNPSPLRAISASVSGFAQFYVKDKGMLTVEVASASSYTLDPSYCLLGGTLGLKYADGSPVVASFAQDICLSALMK